jgi:hypothetical protein
MLLNCLGCVFYASMCILLSRLTRIHALGIQHALHSPLQGHVAKNYIPDLLRLLHSADVLYGSISIVYITVIWSKLQRCRIISIDLIKDGGCLSSNSGHRGCFVLTLLRGCLSTLLIMTIATSASIFRSAQTIRGLLLTCEAA